MMLSTVFWDIVYLYIFFGVMAIEIPSSLMFFGLFTDELNIEHSVSDKIIEIENILVIIRLRDEIGPDKKDMGMLIKGRNMGSL